MIEVISFDDIKFDGMSLWVCSFFTPIGDRLSDVFDSGWQVGVVHWLKTVVGVHVPYPRERLTWNLNLTSGSFLRLTSENSGTSTPGRFDTYLHFIICPQQNSTIQTLLNNTLYSVMSDVLRFSSLDLCI